MYNSTKQIMRLNAGILTEKLQETRAFYVDLLEFTVTFENEFYLLLRTPNGEDALSFLLPNHPTQDPLFHAPFNGQGVYLTLEVDDVTYWYEKLKAKSIEIKVALRKEPWGDHHFAVQCPNGIGIDYVTYISPRA